MNRTLALLSVSVFITTAFLPAAAAIEIDAPDTPQAPEIEIERIDLQPYILIIQQLISDVDVNQIIENLCNSHPSPCQPGYLVDQACNLADDCDPNALLQRVCAGDIQGNCVDPQVRKVTNAVDNIADQYCYGSVSYCDDAVRDIVCGPLDDCDPNQLIDRVCAGDIQGNCVDPYVGIVVGLVNQAIDQYCRGNANYCDDEVLYDLCGGPTTNYCTQKVYTLVCGGSSSSSCNDEIYGNCDNGYTANDCVAYANRLANTVVGVVTTTVNNLIAQYCAGNVNYCDDEAIERACGGSTANDCIETACDRAPCASIGNLINDEYSVENNGDGTYSVRHYDCSNPYWPSGYYSCYYRTVTTVRVPSPAVARETGGSGVYDDRVRVYDTNTGQTYYASPSACTYGVCNNPSGAPRVQQNPDGSTDVYLYACNTNGQCSETRIVHVPPPPVVDPCAQYGICQTPTATPHVNRYSDGSTSVSATVCDSRGMCATYPVATVPGFDACADAGLCQVPTVTPTVSEDEGGNVTLGVTVCDTRGDCYGVTSLTIPNVIDGEADGQEVTAEPPESVTVNPVATTPPVSTPAVPSVSFTVPAVDTPTVPLPQVCTPFGIVCVGPVTVPAQHVSDGRTVSTPAVGSVPVAGPMDVPPSTTVPLPVDAEVTIGFEDILYTVAPNVGEFEPIGPIHTSIPAPIVGEVPVTICAQTCPIPVGPGVEISTTAYVTVRVGETTYSWAVPVSIDA